MHYDNRVLDINGEGTEALLLALKIAFLQEGFNCKGWSESKKGIILHWSGDVKGVHKLPSDQKGLSPEDCIPIILNYLKSDEADKVELDGWFKDVDIDGSTSKGWRVFVEDWGHVDNHHTAICCISPSYLWHGK